MTNNRILLEAIQDILILIKKYRDCVSGWKDIDNPTPEEYDKAINYLIDIVEIVSDEPITSMFFQKYEELSRKSGGKEMIQ